MAVTAAVNSGLRHSSTVHSSADELAGSCTSEGSPASLVSAAFTRVVRRRKVSKSQPRAAHPLTLDSAGVGLDGWQGASHHVTCTSMRNARVCEAPGRSSCELPGMPRYCIVAGLVAMWQKGIRLAWAQASLSPAPLSCEWRVDLTADCTWEEAAVATR